MKLEVMHTKVRAALAEGDEAEEPAAWTGASEQDPAYQ